MDTGFLNLIDDVVGLDRIGDRDTIVERLSELTSRQVSNFCDDLSKALPRPDRSGGQFRFAGNSTLSALPYPCAGLGCRSEHLTEVANFTALYAEHTVLFNPFQRLVAGSGVKLSKKPSSGYLEEVAFHISGLLMLSPLIERGMCSFEDEVSQRFCRNCFERGIAMIVENNPALEEDSSYSLFFRFLDYYNSTADVKLSELRRRNAVLSSLSEVEVAGHPIFYTVPRERIPTNIKIGDKLSKEQLMVVDAGHSFAHHASNDFFQTTLSVEIIL